MYKIIRNLHIRYIRLHNEITLQNALRHNFAQLSPATFSEFEGENFLLGDAYSKKIFRVVMACGYAMICRSLSYLATRERLE